MDPLVRVASKGGTAIIKLTTKRLREWVGYVNSYNENLANLRELRERLISKQKDVQLQVENGERRGEKIADQVEKWQDWAKDLLENLDKDPYFRGLLMDEDSRKAADKCCLKLIDKNPKLRHDLSLKAQKVGNIIKGRIDELNGLSSFTRSMGPPSLGSAGQRDFCQHLLSRQDDAKKIIEALKDEKIRKIGIHGMGGAGKTTLAEEVARRAENEKLFSTVVIVEISRIPSIKHIQDRIAERIGLPLDGIHTVEERRLKLYDRLKDLIRQDKKKAPTRQNQSQSQVHGKLLLILDNVWSKQDLSPLGIDYDIETHAGCKIVVTSRDETVCKQMGAALHHIYKVGDLTLEEGKILFWDKIGNTSQQDQRYEEIVERLLIKCSRLPLSINILADTLRNHELNFWELMDKKLEHRGHGEIVGVLSKTYSVLELSYDNIGNEEQKRFFLLCCLFPIGSNINMVDLLRYGIGLGLFQYQHSLDEAIEQVKIWTSDLKSLSLLLDVDTHKEEIKIHDDVREAGKLMATKGDNFGFYAGTMPQWMEEKTYQKYAAITVELDNSNNHHKFLSCLHLPNLQLLHLQGVPKLLDDYFTGMARMSVLHLSNSNIRKFPASIGQMSSLKTLLIQGCILGDISQICRLINLQVLSLKGSKIKSLPKDIGKLVNLRILDLTSCEKLKNIPPGILAKLTQLEGLYIQNSFNDWDADGCHRASISELECCPSLQMLEIDIRSTGQVAKGDFPTCIPSLSKFKIRLGDQEMRRKEDSFLAPGMNRYLKVRNVLRSELMKLGWQAILKQAECVAMYELGGSGWHVEEELHKSVPDCFFAKLQELCLFQISGIEYAIPAIDSPKELKVLKVEQCAHLKFVMYATTAFDVVQFPCLREVILKDLVSFEGFCEKKRNRTAHQGISTQTLFTNKIKFPCLEKLDLTKLENITQLWDMTSGEEFKTSFPELRHISISWMSTLKYIWSKRSICKGESFYSSNLEGLEIDNCNKLESICPPSVAVNGFQRLQRWNIICCDTIKQIISTEVVAEIAPNRASCFSSSTRLTWFPQLLSMKLEFCRSLVCFYKGRLNMKFPALKRLELTGLHSFETLVKPDRGLFATGNDDMVTLSEHVEDETSEYGYGTRLKTLFTGEEITFPLLEDLLLFSLNEVELLWDAIKNREFARAFPNLQNITVWMMPKLKHVWSNITHGELSSASPGISNLIKVEIIDCSLMKSVCPPVIARRLESLEFLRIMECSNLKQIISTEQEENSTSTETDRSNKTICFPMLLSIELMDLDTLTCFYQGGLRIEFPALKKLKLNRLGNLMTFIKPLGHCWRTGANGHDTDHYGGCCTTTSLFSNEEVMMPSLEQITLQSLNNIEIIWDACDYEEISFKLLKLHAFRLSDMVKLRAIWKGTSIYNLIGTSKVTEINDCEMSPSVIFPMRPFATLQSPVLESPRQTTTVQFLSLKRLHLQKLPFEALFVRPDKDDDMAYMGATQAGKADLIRNRAPSLALFSEKFRFPILEELKIEDMSKLERMFDRVDGPEWEVDAATFPCLKTLDLVKCPMLKHFSPSMLQNISSLLVSDIAWSRCLFSTATSIDAIARARGFSIRSLSQLQNLEELVIKNCHVLEELFDGDQHDIIPRMKTLKLSGLWKLKRIPYHRFPNLQSIEISECKASKFLIDAANLYDEPVLQGLEQLKVMDCDNLEAIVVKQKSQGWRKVLDYCPQLFEPRAEVVEFPLLAKVELSGMPSIYAFSLACTCVRFRSLRSLKVSGCFNIRLFCSGNIEAPKLHSAYLNDTTVQIDEDLNLIMARKFEDSNKGARDWPVTSQHELHMKYRHRLCLTTINGSYTCDTCGQEGSGWSYSCQSNCNFKVHRECLLQSNGSNVHNDPDEATTSTQQLRVQQPKKDWAKVEQMRKHYDHHPLKLKEGRKGTCRACRKGLTSFSYCCDDCGFYMHPNCDILEDRQESDNCESFINNALSLVILFYICLFIFLFLRH